MSASKYTNNLAFYEQPCSYQLVLMPHYYMYDTDDGGTATILIYSPETRKLAAFKYSELGKHIIEKHPEFFHQTQCFISNIYIYINI